KRLRCYREDMGPAHRREVGTPRPGCGTSARDGAARALCGIPVRRGCAGVRGPTVGSASRPRRLRRRVVPRTVGREGNLAAMAGLGELEKAVMNHLWAVAEPQTVRQVHAALSEHRDLAYTTVMTVLQRLARKDLVVQHRSDRAHQYTPVHSRDELV